MVKIRIYGESFQNLPMNWESKCRKKFPGYEVETKGLVSQVKKRKLINPKVDYQVVRKNRENQENQDIFFVLDDGYYRLNDDCGIPSKRFRHFFCLNSLEESLACNFALVEGIKDFIQRNKAQLNKLPQGTVSDLNLEFVLMMIDSMIRQEPITLNQIKEVVSLYTKSRSSQTEAIRPNVISQTDNTRMKQVFTRAVSNLSRSTSTYLTQEALRNGLNSIGFNTPDDFLLSTLAVEDAEKYTANISQGKPMDPSQLSLKDTKDRLLVMFFYYLNSDADRQTKLMNLVIDPLLQRLSILTTNGTTQESQHNRSLDGIIELFKKNKISKDVFMALLPVDLPLEGLDNEQITNQSEFVRALQTEKHDGELIKRLELIYQNIESCQGSPHFTSDNRLRLITST